jgi:hypothetical protein
VIYKVYNHRYSVHFTNMYCEMTSCLESAIHIFAWQRCIDKRGERYVQYIDNVHVLLHYVVLYYVEYP